MNPAGAFACMLARPRRPPPLVRAVSVEHGPVHGASRSWLPVFAGRRARLGAAIAGAQRLPSASAAAPPAPRWSPPAAGQHRPRRIHLGTLGPTRTWRDRAVG